MVQEDGGDWQTLDNIWISNGVTNDQARVEMRMQLEEDNHE
jgi:hypothetical protein